MTFTRDWKEEWIDRMGLIVVLGGKERFEHLNRLKFDMTTKLNCREITELKEAIRMRFTPTNGQDGCQSGIQAVKEATT